MSSDEIRLSVDAWGTIRPELFWIYDGCYAQGQRISGPSLAPFRIWWIRTGTAEVAYPAATLAASAGDWLILPAAPRWQRLAPQTRLVSLAIDSATHGGAELLSAIQPQRLAGEQTALARVVGGLLAWSVAHAEQRRNQRLFIPPLAADAFAELQALLGRLAGILVGLAPGHLPASRDARLHRLWGVLAAHAAAPFPSVAVMEAETGLGWRRLQQLCLRDWRMTPRDTHQRMRLRMAMTALADGGHSVKAVARTLGFDGADRFSHWFKRCAGVSPLAWRRHIGL